MSPSRSSSSSPAPPPRLVLLVAAWFVLSCLLSSAHALHFYIEDSKPKCFSEELPAGTIVHGTYRTEEYSTQSSAFVENTAIGVTVEVTAVASAHQIVRQKGDNAGSFTFTATESGDHSICVNLADTKWFTTKRVRMHWDVVIGELNREDDDAVPDSKLDDLTYRLRDMNYRCQDIRREQKYQRERESEFRDFSEAVNGRVVRWTLAQMCVLGVTCTWQLRHLKSFFMAKKLV
ncbi:emp24p/erv25p- protein [Sorochytrium milnesiophthora]